MIRLMVAVLLAVAADAGAPDAGVPDAGHAAPLPPPIKMQPQPIPRPPPEPTAASCWMAACTREVTNDGYELAAHCPAGARARRLQFDSAEGKGDPIVACLCCPLYKVKTPPRVFEEN